MRGRLRGAARAIAAEREDRDLERLVVAVSGSTLTRHGGLGEPRIVVQLVRSALGPVPTVGRASYGSLNLAAATAVLAVCLAPADSDIRLASALAIEGLG